MRPLDIETPSGKASFNMKVSKLTLTVTLISLICVILGFLLLLFNVQILQRGIDGKKLLQDGTEAYENWMHIPAPLYVKVYLFNLTNADEVVAGSSDIVVNEVGPYVFLDNREKIVYDDDGETITYLPQSLFEFLPELSAEGVSLSDMITTVNVPLVSTASMTKEFEGKQLVLNAIKAVVKKNFNLLETRSVDELVFGGYDSPIFDSVRKLTPLMEKMGVHKEIPEKMGILYDKNMTAKEGNWTVGVRGQEFSELKLWNGSPLIGKWKENSTCNEVRGTDGLQFHADVKSSDRLDFFTGVFCRSIGFTFDHDDTLFGIDVKQFSQNSVYNSKLEEDRCYCTANMDCEKDGISDLGPCQSGAPVFLSKPHFLGAPDFQTNITGINPDPRLHDGWLKIEPWLGITTLGGIRLQVNIALTPNKFLDIPFADNMLPLLWLEGTNRFSDQEVNMLNSLLFNKITILRAVAAVTLLIGLVLAAAFLYYNRRRKGQFA